MGFGGSAAAHGGAPPGAPSRARAAASEALTLPASDRGERSPPACVHDEMIFVRKARKTKNAVGKSPR